MALTPTTRVALLDGFVVCRGDGGQGEVRDLPRVVQRLVARLSLSRCPDRSAIAGQLWPDVPEDRAHGSLRSAVWRLQKVAPGMIDVSAGSLVLADHVRVDARELDTWALHVLDPCVHGRDLAAPDDALGGELLPGWQDDWVLLERERLRQLRMHALEALTDKLVAAGRFGEAAHAAHSAVRAEPLRESAHRAVVRVHVAEGNLIEALRAYESFRTMLADELGIPPTAQMTRLIATARRGPDGPAGRTWTGRVQRP